MSGGDINNYLQAIYLMTSLFWNISPEIILSNLSSSFLHAPIYRNQNTSNYQCSQYHRHLTLIPTLILFPTPLLPTPSRTLHRIVRHKSLQQSPPFNLPLQNSHLNHLNSLQRSMKIHIQLSSVMFLMTLFPITVLQPTPPHHIFPLSVTKTMV